MRQVRKRFGPAAVEQNQPLLQRVTDAQALEDLCEALLDSPDATAWLDALRKAAS